MIALKKLYILLGISVVAAIALTLTWKPQTAQERLIQLQAEDAPPALAEALKGQPTAVQAVLLGYADNKVLLLKAEAALASRPKLAREILAKYGGQREFQEVLATYGDSILPPIHYFLHNEVHTLAVMHYAAQQYQQAKSVARSYLGSAAESDTEPESQTDQTSTDQKRIIRESDPSGTKVKPLTPTERGWYAVSFIKQDGHDFLGQFVTDKEGLLRDSCGWPVVFIMPPAV